MLVYEEGSTIFAFPVGMDTRRDSMDPILRERIYRDTLIPALDADDQAFLHGVSRKYELDFDEIQTLANAARDLEMWRETPLSRLWTDWSCTPSDEPSPSKKSLLQALDEHLERLRNTEKVYPTEPMRGLTRARTKLVQRQAPTRVFTPCPYFTAAANCCQLHIIEAVTGCALGCSFCNVNASMGEMVEFSADLAERLSGVELDPHRFYHVSTSHMSDSLVWGNRHGILDALFEFARRHPNVQLELKTKSDRIDYLLRHEIPRNIICSWWINTDTLIRNEEHGTAGRQGRLRAARQLCDRGCALGFHINPIVRYRGWQEDYTSLVAHVMGQFSPEEIEFISLGALWLSPPVVRGIRHRGGESKILQMPLVADPADKLTYPHPLRIELYKEIHRALQPWQDKVFVFLCMETTLVWEAVFGQSVPVHQKLERLFRRRVQTGGHQQEPVGSGSIDVAQRS